MFTKEEKHLEQISKQCLKEAKEFLNGPPIVWWKKISDDVTSGEILGQMLKANIPFATGQVRTDCLLVHELSTTHGIVYAVHPFSDVWPLPTQFIIILEGRIPHSIALALRKIGRKWGVPWTTFEEESFEMDPFGNYLNNLEYLIPHKRRKKTQKLREAIKDEADFGFRSKIKLKWWMQLVALSENRFLFIFKHPAKYTYEDFGLDIFINMVDAIKTGVQEYNYSGPPPDPKILIPAEGFLVVSEIAGDQPEREYAITYQDGFPVPKSLKKIETNSTNEEPLKLAKLRLAKGEITTEEFEEIRKALEA